MKKRTIAVCLVLAITSLANVAAFADTVQRDGFTISIPDGWVEIPRYVLDDFEASLAAGFPSTPRQHWDCGFQKASATNMMEFPYILVQVHNFGRIPEQAIEQLEDDKMLQEYWGAVLGIAVDAYAPSIFSEQIVKASFDKPNNTILSTIRMENEIVGSVYFLSSMILTEKGIINVFGYALKERYALYEPVFLSVVRSVTPEPWLEYKASWKQDSSLLRIGTFFKNLARNTFLGALVGGVIGVLMALWKRSGGHRRRRPDSRESL